MRAVCKHIDPALKKHLQLCLGFATKNVTFTENVFTLETLQDNF